MKFAKIRFSADDACARALKGLASRMKITVLADESFIVPEAGVDWLKSEQIPFQIIEWVNQDHVVQALRDNLAHPVYDGSPVEPEKYLITRREIAARFGALTFLPQPIHGEWMHQEVRYEDVNLRIVVDVEDTPQSAEFFARLKETLKERFCQIEIWMVSYEIRIV